MKHTMPNSVTKDVGLAKTHKKQDLRKNEADIKEFIL